MKPSSCVALLLLLFAAPAVGGPRRIEPNTDSVLELAPDLKLSVDWRTLSVESPRAKTTLPVAYGSSSRGFPDVIQYAVVTPSGSVTLHYQSWCGGSGLTQTTSLAELRAKLLLAEAEQRPTLEARALVERANALAPSEPTAAVARAALEGTPPGRAEALLAPALAAAHFETYFELARRAPALLELPSVRNLRATTPGDAQLGRAALYAVAGSYVALSVAAETEADCASTDELLLLDLRLGSVVFRRAFIERDAECHETRVNTDELNRMLRDLGFRSRGELVNPDGGGVNGEYVFTMQSGYQLELDREHHLARAKRGGKVVWTKYWSGTDSPRRAALIAEAHVLLLETNRDSDVCEGLPSFELYRLGGP